MTVPDTMTPDAAEALFHSLPPVTIADMQGTWKGRAIATGHPLDILLARASWYGKRFVGDEAHPLIHDSMLGRHPINPGLLPMGLAMRLRLGHWPGLPVLFKLILPLLATRRPRARLRMIDTNGILSAAMIYDQKPIIDQFRRASETSLMGRMDRRGDGAPCYFALERGI